MNQSTNSPVAVRVSRKGLTNLSDLESIRKQLFGNSLALKYIGSFLNYANSVLSAAERACRHTLRPGQSRDSLRKLGLHFLSFAT